MAFLTGKAAAAFVNQYDLSAFVSSTDLQQMVDSHESTTYGQTAKTYIPGLRDGTASLSGYADYGAAGTEDIISGLIQATTDPIFTLGFNGTTIGNRGKIFQGLLTQYSQGIPVGDIITFALNTQPTGGIDNAVFLHALGAETGTMNGASVDNAASSANGYSATYHCTVDNITSATGKIQHAPDNATWADLATFTGFAAVGAQFISGTGTVDRYVRFIISAFSGTTFTFVVAFARR